jgi:adenylate kinase family enzyme
MAAQKKKKRKAVHSRNYRKMYFLMSQSGGGKDTQAELITKWFQKKNIPYIYLSIGTEVRLLTSTAQTERGRHFPVHMKSINDEGKLQPAVMPLYFALTKLIQKYTGNEVIIINGSPRSDKEVVLWNDLMVSEYLPPATVLHIKVTDTECRKRLTGRTGRNDTQNAESLRTKLGWYKPVRKLLRKKKIASHITVAPIDGMGSIKKTAQNIKRFLKEDVKKFRVKA